VGLFPRVDGSEAAAGVADPSGIWPVAATRASGRRVALRVRVAIPAAILAVAMSSRINIGIRHILPAFPFFAIIAAAGLLWLVEQSRRSKWALWTAAAASGWFVISSLAVHPDYLAYFNALAGDEPERIVVDSDLDWGQDIKRLGQRLRELNAPSVTYTPTITISLAYHGFPPHQLSTPDAPARPSAAGRRTAKSWPVSRSADSSGRDAALLLDADDIRRHVDFMGRGRLGSGAAELSLPGASRRTHSLLVAVPVVGLSVSRRSASGRVVSAELAVLSDRRFSACAGGGALAAFALLACLGAYFLAWRLLRHRPAAVLGRALLRALGIFHRPQLPYSILEARPGCRGCCCCSTGFGIARVALHDSRWTGSGNADSGRPLSNHLV
jgi:hypothetical protein